jgi:hypothetical protein
VNNPNGTPEDQQGYIVFPGKSTDLALNIKVDKKKLRKNSSRKKRAVTHPK